MNAPLPTIQFSFDERRAAQAAGLLLRLRPGRRCSRLVLLKLLYLADREALLRSGRPITGDRMVAMELGPVLSRIFDLLKEPIGGGAAAWSVHVRRTGENSYEPTDREDTSELSSFEVELLHEISARYGQHTPWQLSELTHGFPEWHDPGESSAPIDPADILRAAAVDEDEIAEIAQSNEEARVLRAVMPK